MLGLRGRGQPAGGGARLRAAGRPPPGRDTAGRAGRDYRLGYTLGALGGAGTRVELGVDAQRRESPMLGGASTGGLGRATVDW